MAAIYGAAGTAMVAPLLSLHTKTLITNQQKITITFITYCLVQRLIYSNRAVK